MLTCLPATCLVNVSFYMMWGKALKPHSKPVCLNLTKQKWQSNLPTIFGRTCFKRDFSHNSPVLVLPHSTPPTIFILQLEKENTWINKNLHPYYVAKQSSISVFMETKGDRKMKGAARKWPFSEVQKKNLFDLGLSGGSPINVELLWPALLSMASPAERLYHWESWEVTGGTANFRVQL